MARLPADWSEPTKRMSFSALTDIKGCHLRWGLTRAPYHGMWACNGYPSKLTIGVIVG